MGAGSPTLRAARDEVARGLRGMLGADVPLVDAVSRDGALVAGTPSGSPAIAALDLGADLGKVGDEGFLVRPTTIAGKRATVVAANTDVGVLYGVFRLLQRLQAGHPVDALSRRRGPANPPPGAQPLGQPGPDGRARLRRLLAVGLAQAARLRRPAHHRLRARERVDRDQRHGPDQRQRERHEPPPRVPREGGGPGGGTPALRHPGLPHRTVQRPGRDRGAEDGRPPRPGGRGLVEAQGRRDLRGHPRLRGLPGQGQLRGPARAAGLRPLPRGRRERAGRRGRPARRRRDVAGLRVLERGARRPREAGVRRVPAPRRAVPAERARAGQERADRLPAPRALPPPLRRDAEDAADAGAPGHPGVPRLRHAPRVPGAALRGGAARGHAREGSRLHRRPGDRRVPSRPRPDRHRRGRQRGDRPQLVRGGVRLRQLARLRAPGLGPHADVRRDRRRVDPRDASGAIPRWWRRSRR